MQVQSIPSQLDKEATPDFKSRVLVEFTPDQQNTVSSVSEVIQSPVYAQVEYEEYFYLPETTSAFLIKLGSEADDLAYRYNTLLKYTKGLLTAIDQSNNVVIGTGKKP